MTIARFFLFLVLFALTTKAWGQGQTPLVYIYCDYLTSKSPTIENDQSWNELVRHFEKREFIHQDRGLQENPKFKECVQKNSQLFETGEFIFEGREQIQSSLGVLKEKSVAPTLVSMESLSLSHEWYSVTLPLNRDTGERAAQEEDMVQREKRYSALWQDFLSSLKQSAIAASN